MIAYKSLTEDGLSTYRKFPWPLPKGNKPGKWVDVGVDPVLCQRGLHGWKSLDTAKKNGSIVYEMELAGPIVSDHEKVAARRARLVRVAYQFEPYVVVKGIRRCKRCGEPHNGRKINNSDLAPQWGHPEDGHSYSPETWTEYLAFVRDDIPRRIAAFHAAASEARELYIGPGSYDPVVPAYHGPFKDWQDHPDRCGTCGLGEEWHVGVEERAKLKAEFDGFSRWDLMEVIRIMRGAIGDMVP